MRDLTPSTAPIQCPSPRRGDGGMTCACHRLHRNEDLEAAGKAQHDRNSSRIRAAANGTWAIPQTASLVPSGKHTSNAGGCFRRRADVLAGNLGEQERFCGRPGSNETRTRLGGLASLLNPAGEGDVFDPVLRGEAAGGLAAAFKGFQQNPALLLGEAQPPELVRPDQSRLPIHRCRVSDTDDCPAPRTYGRCYGPRLPPRSLNPRWSKSCGSGRRR